MVAAQQLQPNPLSAAEDLRKHVIRLMQNNGEETRSNVLVLPQVFLEFLDYDHKMALFLNQLLYWTERTKQPAAMGLQDFPRVVSGTRLQGERRPPAALRRSPRSNAQAHADRHRRGGNGSSAHPTAARPATTGST